MLGVKYRTVFYSINNVHWRIDFLVEGATGDPLEVRLSADDGAMMEWVEVDKIEPVQSSRLTVKLISDKDRIFLNAGIAAAEVYKDEVLYWRGMLDEEIYEEPYSYSANYECSFIFSDFGPLSRIKYTGSGVQSLSTIITTCMTAAGLGTLQVNQRTALADQTSHVVIPLSKICINVDRMEEDERYMRTVLDETLKPFGFRLIQRNGKIWVYDLDTLYNLKDEALIWHSDDAVISYDKRFGYVKVNFSPSANSTLIDGSIDPEDVLPCNEEMMPQVWHEYDVSAAVSDLNVGFRIISGFANTAVKLSNGAKVFRIKSEYSGRDEAGFAYYISPCLPETIAFTFPIKPSPAVAPGTTPIEIMRISSGIIPTITPEDRRKYRIRLNLDLMLDVRFNPFEEGKVNNCESAFKTLQASANYALVPCILNLLDAEGTAIYHYRNRPVYGSYGNPSHPGIPDFSTSCNHVECEWVSGAGGFVAETQPGIKNDMYLCYYDDDRKDKSALGGWTTNRNAVGLAFFDDLPSAWTLMDNGEYIPLPPTAGRLQLIIGHNIAIYDGASTGTAPVNFSSLVRWQMYKSPKIELVKRNGKAVEDKDVTAADWYNGLIDDINVDTQFGTGQEGVTPAAAGMVLDTLYEPIKKFYKNGASLTLEEHMLSMVRNQYKDSNLVLSGTVDIVTGLNPITESLQSGKFILLSDRQNLHDDTSFVKIAHLVPAYDIYTFAWSEAVCVLEVYPYGYRWSDKICVKVAHYGFAWSNKTVR
jgi:hypothetical protein